MTMSPPTLVVDSIMVGPALMLINQYLNVPVQEGGLLRLVMVSLAHCQVYVLHSRVTGKNILTDFMERAEVFCA